MNIVPKAGPSSESNDNPPSNKAAEARARAIAKLTGQGGNVQQSQSAPVSDPTNVSVEEISAISPPSVPEANVVDGQADTNDVSTEAPAAPEATKAAPKAAEEAPLSAQYAQLARKEKALRAKVLETKAKEEALAAREAAVQARESQYSQTDKYIPRDRFESDPVSVLNESGLTYDKITELMINQPKVEDISKHPVVSKLVAKIEKLEKDAEDRNKNYADNQNAQYKQALDQIRRDADTLVKADEAYEMIQGTGSVGDVVDLIEKTFREDGVLLSVEEAAQAVEEYLVEEALKITKLKKIQQRFAPAKPESKPQTQEKQPPQMKTLTNAVGTSRQLSAKERAILAFKGELRK